MSDSTLGQYQNQIAALPPLNDLRYENIFRVYQTNQNQYYYNILNTIYLPEQIDSTKTYTITVKQNMPWTMISYNAYQTIELWWLICLVNKIYNPIKNPSTGTTLQIVQPQYVRQILDEIKAALA